MWSFNKGVAFLIALSIFFIYGCTGRIQYSPPTAPAILKNSVVIYKSKDAVWKTIIPALGKSFFIINTLDKESGIINVSYSADPQDYVDCGNIYSYLQNTMGKRGYHFSAAEAHQTYEIMDRKDLNVFSIDRRMQLEGRINIIVEELSSDKTEITANIVYILTKINTVRNDRKKTYLNNSDKITFVSGQYAVFPNNKFEFHDGIICQPNGKLEDKILTILLSDQKQEEQK